MVIFTLYFYILLILPVLNLCLIPVYATEKSRWHIQRILQRDPPTEDQIKTGKSEFDLSSVVMVHPVFIYVVDSGVRITHNEFGGRAEVGINMVRSSHNASDCSGHGTHVAALAAGAKSGVAKHARVISVRVLNCEAKGNCAVLVDALLWILADVRNRNATAVENKTSVPRFVVLMSIGSSSSSCKPTEIITRMLWDKGVVVVAAAGNDKIDSCSVYPVRSKRVIGVGATDSNDHVYQGNNYGKCVDLFAPGVKILSAWGYPSDNTFHRTTGTSMAAPLVAGTAAVILGSNPSLTPKEVRYILISSCSKNVLHTPTGAESRLKGAPNRLLYAPWSRALNDIRTDAGQPKTKSWKPSITANEIVPMWNSSTVFSSISFSLQPRVRPSMVYAVSRVNLGIARMIGIDKGCILARRAPGTRRLANGSEPTTLHFKLYIGMNALVVDEYHRRLLNESELEILYSSVVALDGFELRGKSMKVALEMDVGVPRGAMDWEKTERPAWLEPSMACFVAIGLFFVLMVAYISYELYNGRPSISEFILEHRERRSRDDNERKEKSEEEIEDKVAEEADMV